MAEVSKGGHRGVRALARLRGWALGPGRPSALTADRLVLLFLAVVALKFANWGWLTARVPGRVALLANAAIQFLAFGIFVVLIALSCRDSLPGWLRRLRLGRFVVIAPVLLVLIFGLVSASVTKSLVTDDLRIDDANAMAVCGAQAISSGHDPYQVSELSCLRRLGLSPSLATPLRVGSLATVASYPSPAQIAAAVRAARAKGGSDSIFSGLGKPPLDPLTMLPVARAPAQVRALWTLLAVVVFAAALAAAAGWLWLAVLAAFLATFYIPGSALNFASFGNAEAVAYLLMALAVLWMKRPIVSGVCLGLALGSNELALFFLPAYLLLSFRLAGLPRRLLGAGLAVLIAVVPWLVRYPDALPTIFHNLSAPTFPLGYGPIELVVGGVLKPPPSDLMLGLTAAAMVLILVWGWRRPVWRVAASVLLLSAFWLSWRSLDEYMAQIPLLALAAIVGLLAPTESAKETLRPQEPSAPLSP
jgi:hypothetical protein